LDVKEASMGKPRMLLADDHSLVLEGLRQLLEPQFDVAGIVTKGRQLLEIAPTLPT
jgi:DNA-binding NarL/FixJ family response regulator